MHRTINPLTRRSLLHRGVRLSTVMAIMVGAARVPDVAARKNTEKKSPYIKPRVQAQREARENIGGGMLSVGVCPGGTTTTNTSGNFEG